MSRQPPRIIAAVLVLAHAMLVYGGCAGLARGPEESSREFGGVAAGERITTRELDGLTRAMADGYIGRLYSICDGIAHANPEPAERRAAQVLLTDNATNLYDIASNADPFTRMLDLVVVTTLVSFVWDEEGRAAAVFGERGRLLADALTREREQFWTLAARVLTGEQLETLRSLLRTWRRENPEMVRVSFVRFSAFSHGRDRSAAANVLQAGGLFPGIQQAGQAVDEARDLAGQVFHWLKRAPTLLRWQAAAAKDGWAATPEVGAALDDLHRLTDAIERLPDQVASERRAILDGVEELLEQADGTIADVRGALDDATAFVDMLEPLTNSLEDAFEEADDLVTRFDEMSRRLAEDRGRPFDIREYQQVVEEVTLATREVDDVLTRAEHLLGSRELEGRIEDVNESVDERLVTAAEQGRTLVRAFFWRACALLVVFFLLLGCYRTFVVLFLRPRITRV